MDRSELARDLEQAPEPQTVRTAPDRAAAAATRRPPTAHEGGPATASVVALEAARERLSFGTAFPAAETRGPHVRGFRPYASLVLRLAAYVFCGWLAVVLLLLVIYRFADPPASALMLRQALFGHSYEQTWVPLEAVSGNAVRAVLASEDGRFCAHGGVDYDALQEAIERAGDGAPRGASTISMQVVKNLFLWPSKSYLRKIVEIPLTYAMELLWPKRRILEVYLNIAEWGPGIFGIEAAARYHFAKPAAKLSEREAAQLAVALPNPIRRDAGDPGPRTSRLASLVQYRMRALPAQAAACLRRGR